MIPVLQPAEMAAVDAAVADRVEDLIEAAGAGVARSAAEMLGGVYGRRVVVVAGRGNNGADGRAAARRLRARGAAVEVLEATEVKPGQRLGPCDLVIDAAYGTGLRRAYYPPDVGGAPVLAVDIPSGLSGVTGEVVGKGEGGGAPRATRTVTFAALKPGQLLGEGPDRCGTIELVDIGLGDAVAGSARSWLVQDADARMWLPARRREAHKWQAAVRVVAGSPGMVGAAWLVSHSAMRAGAGYVRLSVPGAEPAALGLPPSELVVTGLPARGWARQVLTDASRFSSIVVGPGLGSGAGSGPGGRPGAGAGAGAGAGPRESVAEVLAQSKAPVVVDADGLNLLGSFDQIEEITSRRGTGTVLTPHEGEYARLAGDPVRPDRVEDVRASAARAGAVVLLKGSTTVIAEPGGKVLFVSSGSSRLATAGTGDVLSGVIGAFLARGVPPLEAAGLGAHVHGRAASLGYTESLVAGDLPELVAEWLSSP